MTARFRRREDGAYPIEKAQFLGMYPDMASWLVGDELDVKSMVAFGILPRLGLDLVYPTPQPETTILDRVKEAPPRLDGVTGTWHQVWEVEDIAATLDQHMVANFIAKSRAEAIEALEVARLKAEAAGIVRSGQVILTDDKASAQVTDAYLFLQADPDFLMDWPTSAGGWITVDLAFISATFKIIQNHKQRCRALARQAYNQIQTLRHPRDMVLVINAIQWPL